MAVIYVTNAGGSIGLAATYVGGILPTQEDIIGFNLTSGNLDVDSTLAIAGIDFTNCTSIINFTTPITLNNVISHNHSINLGSGGYSLTGAVEIKWIGAVTALNNLTLTANGIAYTGILSAETQASCTMNFTDVWNQNGEFKTLNAYILFIGGTFNINGIFNGDVGISNLGAFYIPADSTTIMNFNGIINLVFFEIGGGVFNYISGSTLTITQVVFNVGTIATIDFSDFIINDCIIYAGSITAYPNFVTPLRIVTLAINNEAFLGGSNNNIECDNFISTTFGVDTITLASNSEIKVNNSITIATGSNSPLNLTIKSSIPGVKAKLTLGQNIDQNRVVFINATDIDSSSGVRVNNFFGTATNCDNWKVWNETTLPQVASTF